MVLRCGILFSIHVYYHYDLHNSSGLLSTFSSDLKSSLLTPLIEVDKWGERVNESSGAEIFMNELPALSSSIKSN